MQIPSVPNGVRHADWLAFLKEAGFDVWSQDVRTVTAGPDFFGLVVTTARGDVLHVPFTS